MTASARSSYACWYNPPVCQAHNSGLVWFGKLSYCVQKQTNIVSVLQILKIFLYVTKPLSQTNLLALGMTVWPWCWWRSVLEQQFCFGFRIIRKIEEGGEEETHFELSGKSCSRPGTRRVSGAWLAAGPTLSLLYPSLDLISRPCCRKQAELGHMSKECLLVCWQ